MGARAEATEATRRRIVDAAISAFGSRAFEEVGLKGVADDAGVTVQTVLRHFGSKEGLVEAALEAGGESVREARFDLPPGDVEGAIANLCTHYEAWGDRSLLFLAQEGRVEAAARATQAGRALHYEWVDHVFRPWLKDAPRGRRERLRAQLIAATDVYVWKVMRRDLGLDARTTERSTRELVEAIIQRKER